jgi:hypothetical protein
VGFRTALGISLLGVLLLFPGIAPAQTTLDQYGGYVGLPVPGGATGFFRVGKLGNRWVFVTPDGNAFWMRGVYNVTGDDHVDELGDTYNNRLLRKYGSAAVGWAQANRRLQAWGFNTIGPFSYRMTLPVDTEPEWPGGQHPAKMPFVGLAPNPGITGRDQGMFKSLYSGLDATAANVFAYSKGGNFPDVYDPRWQSNCVTLYASDANLALYKASSYFIGYFSDDTDFLNGFGPGVDFPTDPPGKYHWHLGYLALITAPTQVQNPWSSPANQPYTDAKVYTKYALRDYLQARYGTIASLNAAWGASYTTFDSDGGWPTGRGLLDENGRATHVWLGRQDPFYLAGMSTNVAGDLDGFLFELAKTYFATNRTALKAVVPNTLYFGPTNLGGAGWRAPTRGPILKAAGQYLDVINIGTDGSQAQLDFVASWAGDVPIAIWEGTVANADSGRWRHAGTASRWNVTIQGLRGQQYQRDVQALVNGQAGPTGSKPYVGLMWWAWLDSYGEQMNWGLVSLLDNAYDGQEAVIAAGTDPWGYPTGGEERNYGNFLGIASLANASVDTSLVGAPSPTGAAPTVTITSPSSSSFVSGTIPVTATASAPDGVKQINLYLDGTMRGAFSGGQASYSWETTSASNTSHTWTAKAYSSSGSTGQSAPVTITVTNDVTAPTVQIVQPPNGATVGRRTTVMITASAPDNGGVTSVQFYVNGTLLCADASAPYSCNWKVPGARGKTYRLQVQAHDAAGNIGNSAIVTVTSP